MSDYATLLEGARVNTPLPANTAAPVVTGSGKNGQDLTVTNGTWNGAPTSFAYQWRATAVAIGGATKRIYTPHTADVGKAVDCIVTARNVSGATASPASNAITILTNP
jgi:hypothetical protein